jgi:hypothetical protein
MKMISKPQHLHISVVVADKYPSVREMNTYSFLLTSPFLLAFCQEEPTLLRALYNSGCFSFPELCLLHKVALSLPSQLLLPDRQRKCCKLVMDVSQSPPSLQLLCGWRISHLIGCGHDRKHRARELGLPAMLRDFVLSVCE